MIPAKGKTGSRAIPQTATVFNSYSQTPSSIDICKMNVWNIRFGSPA